MVWFGIDVPSVCPLYSKDKKKEKAAVGESRRYHGVGKYGAVAMVDTSAAILTANRKKYSKYCYKMMIYHSHPNCTEYYR